MKNLRFIKSIQVAIFLTLKNLIRGNKGVTTLTIIMLIIVFMNLIFPQALLDGLVYSVNDKTIRVLSSNIVVLPGEDEKFIKNASSLITELKQFPEVEKVTSINTLGAEYNFKGHTSTYTATFITPSEYLEVFDTDDYLIEGEFLSDDDTDYIIMGVQVAGSDQKDLGLYYSSLKSVHAGDKVIVNFSNGVSKEYIVKGIVQAKLTPTDSLVLFNKREFDEMAPLQSDTATKIHIKSNTDDTVHLVGEIGSLQENIKVFTWEETAGFLKDLTSTFTVVLYILKFIAILVAAITIFIVTYVDLTNKRKLIGIQRAIGISAEAIMLLYIFRSILYSIIGLILSISIYIYILVPLQKNYPFDFPIGEVYFYVDMGYIYQILIAIVVVSILSSIIPTLQILRIKIFDAIWS